ncbi:MAG: prepilin-type N-terminal cleavage/methylation domain-containing protein [Candidatus Krumholzibacteriia bacterium]
MKATGQRRRRAPAVGGFALVEVLVALTLFAVGLVTILAGLLGALDLQKDSALRWRAALLLEEKLAESFLFPARGADGRGTSPDGVFAWTVTAKPWPAPPAAAGPSGGPSEQVSPAPPAAPVLREVTVEVSWRTPRGVRRVAASQLVGTPAGREGAP